MVCYWGNANSGADVALKKVTASDRRGIRTVTPLSFDDQHEQLQGWFATGRLVEMRSV
jgi:hypothetical protein